MIHSLIEENEDSVKIKCEGSLENSNDLIFVEDYIEQKMNVILYMSDVDYINSCGFGALVEETMTFADAELKMTIGSIETKVRKTIEILGGEVLLNFLD